MAATIAVVPIVAAMVAGTVAGKAAVDPVAGAVVVVAVGKSLTEMAGTEMAAVDAAVAALDKAAPFVAPGDTEVTDTGQSPEPAHKESLPAVPVPDPAPSSRQTSESQLRTQYRTADPPPACSHTGHK